MRKLQCWVIGPLLLGGSMAFAQGPATQLSLVNAPMKMC